MSVWKKLNKQDSFVTSYVAKKRWTLSGNDLESAGVRLLPAYSNLNPINKQRDPADCIADFTGNSLGDTCAFTVRVISNDTCKMQVLGTVIV